MVMARAWHTRCSLFVYLRHQGQDCITPNARWSLVSSGHRLLCRADLVIWLSHWRIIQFKQSAVQSDRKKVQIVQNISFMN
ncbi:unnamed protein product [Acanthoscelides obtectus]|uniref:Uncharacterized protein n=1 Tax=Acanthoscelides obtectus TaxID=200917 RepID=A0A9P0LMG1_ACAOB|nr:unnamed protein product [Acanthoscelides obtectus]CAK1669159.1 hypothetical protein AOBTE_LOCUS26837 [Acanthoscelides obtectus]